MSGRTKLIATLVAVLALATAGVGAMTLAGSAQPATSGTSSVDVSGNCDEPEHAADPACIGAPTPTPEADASDNPGEDVQGEDVSGPCDEAEHSTDPQCTGTQVEDQNDAQGDAADVGEDANDDHGDTADHEDSTNSGPGDDGGSGSTDSGHDSSHDGTPNDD